VSEWSDAVIELVAERLGLLADRTRVRLLALLRLRGRANVQELADQISSTPQNVSRHLNILYRAGIVARERDGTCIFYSLADYSTCLLLEKVLEGISGQVEELADVLKSAA
jgi:DNA-binding transcriptional ArsR family regulator